MTDLLRRSSIKSLGVAILVVVGLLAVGWAYLQGLSFALDLNSADEGAYIQRAALWLYHHAPLPKEWGPLYELWYAWLLRGTDPPTVFYRNLYLTYLLPPALLAALVYRLTRQGTWSLLAGGLFLISWGNHGDWRVNHFLLGLILLGLLFLPRRPDGAWRSAWVAFQAGWAWLASYVRPEMVLAALAFWLWAFGEAVWRWKRRQRPRGQMVVLLGLFLLALTMTRTAPVGTPSGRMLAAFGQHFAVRWVAKTNSSLNPYHHWARIFEAQFGSVRSIWEAAYRRPDLVAWLVGRNIQGWLHTVACRVTPYVWRHLWRWWALGLALFGLALGLLGYRRWRQDSSIRATLSSWLPWWVAFGFWAGPGILFSWLFYPRPHYQAVPLGLGWAALGMLAAWVWPLPRRGDGTLGLILLLGFGLFGPRPYQAPQPRPHLETVCALRSSLPPAGGHVWNLQGNHMAMLYLADKAQLHWGTESLDVAMRPDLIFPWPLPDEARLKIPWLEALAADPERWGYTVADLPDGSQWLTRRPLQISIPASPPWTETVCSP